MTTDDKYNVPEEEDEILPNLLNLKTKEEISKEEFKGFINAELILLEELNTETVFDIKYIVKLHNLALSHLYGFAGKLRTVNVSKGGFLFPAARFLPEAFADFENQVLLKLPHSYSDNEKLITDIAKVHAELLFIHPFREGNGRVARTLANLMVAKQGKDLLRWEKLTDKHFRKYVHAVQKAADKDYSEMVKIIRLVF